MDIGVDLLGLIEGAVGEVKEGRGFSALIFDERLALFALAVDVVAVHLRD